MKKVAGIAGTVCLVVCVVAYIMLLLVRWVGYTNAESTYVPAIVVHTRYMPPHRIRGMVVDDDGWDGHTLKPATILAQVRFQYRGRVYDTVIQVLNNQDLHDEVSTLKATHGCISMRQNRLLPEFSVDYVDVTPGMSCTVIPPPALANP